MIIIIEGKDFYKNYKAYAKASPIDVGIPMMIINGTSDPKIKDLATGDTIFDCLRAKESICKKGVLKGEDYEHGVEKFLKNRRLLNVMATAIAEIDKSEENNNKPIFIVLNKKTYKSFAKKLRNRFEKVTGADIWFLYDDEKALRHAIEDSLEKKIKKLGKKIDKIRDDHDLCRRDKQEAIDKLEGKIDDIEKKIKDADGKKLLVNFIKYSKVTSKQLKAARGFMKNARSKISI